MSVEHELPDALRHEWAEIKQAQQNPARFEVLYNRYYIGVFRFIYARTSDKELTADITSEVFYKAMTNLHKYEPRGFAFSAWLYRIALNELGMLYRKTNKQRVIGLDEPILRRLEHEVGEGLDMEAYQILLKGMEKLSEAEVALLELRIFEERAFKEVGEILGITENNAKVRFYRTIDKLKAICGGQKGGQDA